jgi:hypothetical protein
MRLRTLAALAGFALAGPAQAAATLSCHMVAYKDIYFTMSVDAEAQAVRIEGGADLFDQMWGLFWSGTFSGKKVVFSDRYIDIWIYQQGPAPSAWQKHPDYGMRLDRQTLNLLPLGDYGDRQVRWVAEGSSCQIRVVTPRPPIQRPAPLSTGAGSGGSLLQIA